MNWSKLKNEIEILVQTYPQRAAQARHAIGLIDQGLVELAKVGYSYEPVLKDTLAALHDNSQTQTLTIDEAVGHVQGRGQPGNPSMVPHEASAQYKSD